MNITDTIKTIMTKVYKVSDFGYYFSKKVSKNIYLKNKTNFKLPLSFSP